VRIDIQSSTDPPNSVTGHVTIHIPWVINPGNTTDEGCFKKMIDEDNTPGRCMKKMMDKWSVITTEIKDVEQGRKLMCSLWAGIL